MVCPPPVTHLLKAIKDFKRFGLGYKPRPALMIIFLRVLRVFVVNNVFNRLGLTFFQRYTKDPYLSVEIINCHVKTDAAL